MSDEDQTAQRVPLDYAEPQLPTGKSFDQLQYPADCVTFLNPAQVVDDGILLQVKPGPSRLRAALLAAGLLAFVVASSYRQIHSRFEFPIVVVCMAAVIAIYSFNRLRTRDRRPWITVDRQRKTVVLPRARKTLAFADIVRLQVVSFARVGWSKAYLSYHGESSSGEVQIVFNDFAGEQTRCVFAWPDARVLKVFGKAFFEATRIPVSRMMPLQPSGWGVRPFDESHAEEQ